MNEEEKKAFIEKYRLLIDNNSELDDVSDINDIEEVLNYLKKKSKIYRRVAIKEILKKK